jgi:hypothetical protein
MIKIEVDSISKDNSGKTESGGSLHKRNATIARGVSRRTLIYWLIGVIFLLGALGVYGDVLSFRYPIVPTWWPIQEYSNSSQ